MCAKSALHTAKSALQGQSVHLLLWLFCTKGCKKTGELLRKREITSLCCITLLTLDLTVCLRDHSFDLRGRHVREMMWNDLREAYADRFDLKCILTAYARGMKPLTPELAPGMLQKCKDATLRNPVFFAHATQSYDTTMFKVYSRGFWRYSGKPCGSCGPLGFLIHSSHPPLFNLRKMSSSFCSRSPGLDLWRELTFQSETMLIDVPCYVLLVK